MAKERSSPPPKQKVVHCNFDEKFAAMHARFDRIEARFDDLDAKLCELITEVRELRLMFEEQHARNKIELDQFISLFFPERRHDSHPNNIQRALTLVRS